MKILGLQAGKKERGIGFALGGYPSFWGSRRFSPPGDGVDSWRWTELDRSIPPEYLSYGKYLGKRKNPMGLKHPNRDFS
jgi:hypothetical protein